MVPSPKLGIGNSKAAWPAPWLSLEAFLLQTTQPQCRLCNVHVL